MLPTPLRPKSVDLRVRMSEATKIERSLVVPVFKNDANIPDLIRAINDSIMPGATAATEVVFVVDGSPDHSYELLRGALPKQSWPSRLLSHSRNFGSICAMRALIRARSSLNAPDGRP
jgi:glycosyltransferase involved in cell wall biosynthesis